MAHALEPDTPVLLLNSIDRRSHTGSVLRPLSAVERATYCHMAASTLSWYWVRTQYGRSLFLRDGLLPLQQAQQAA